MKERMNATGLYLLRRVILTLSGGGSAEGILESIEPGVALTVGGRRYALSDVTDLEHVGEITDYHTYREEGVLGDFLFRPCDLLYPAELERICYGEFRCVAACHLLMEEGRIVARDVRLVSYTHHLHVQELSADEYLYRMRSGAWTVGRLVESASGYRLRRPDGEETPLDPDEIEDITRAPSGNDRLIATLRDGTVVQGLVSAATATTAVLIGEGGAVSLFNYADIRSIRYRGTAFVGYVNTGKGTVKQMRLTVTGETRGGVYICKRVSFRDADASLGEGDTAVFTAAVSERGLIAKDVVPDAVQSEAAEEVYSGRGVIVVYPGAEENSFGYIGKTFVSKICGKMLPGEIPRGTVSFTASQLDFPSAPGREICVVDYTAERSAAEGTADRALTVRLLRSYPYRDYARVHIDEQGEAHALSASCLFLSEHLSQRVELRSADGSVLVGYLAECGREAAVLESCDGTGERVAVPLDSVTGVRYCGTVTSYRPENGVGYIGKFWFHINDLRDANDAVRIARYQRVCFTVIQTAKGSLCAAADITVDEEETQRGYLIGFDGTFCTLTDAEGYASAATPRRYRLDAVRGPIAERLDGTRCEAFDYPIVYSLRRVGEEMRVSLMHVELAGAVRKPLRGYLLCYIKKGGSDSFGFILPEEELEEHLKTGDRTGKLYFREGDVVNPRDYALDTRERYYEVSYVPAPGNTARSVRILAEHAYPRVERETPPAPPERLVSETVSLASIPKNDSLFEGAAYRYGFINICGSQYATIYPSFTRRGYGEENEYDESGYVYVDVARVRFEGEINTKKRVYLVRYVEGEGRAANPSGGADMRSLNYSYPVEILRHFPRKQCLALFVEDERLVVEAVESRGAEPVSVKAEQIPDPLRGESVFLRMKDQSLAHLVYDGQSESAYLFGDGLEVPRAAVERIYRVGVITDFDYAEGTATLNNLFGFRLEAAEQKMVNILRNQAELLRLYVLYAVRDGRICEVLRIPEEFQALLRWEEGTVTAYDGVRRRITVNHTFHHFLSFQLDGGVSRLVRGGMLLGQAVYMRRVRHPYLSEQADKATLMASVVELRVRQELLTVRYDEGRDIYLGYRDQTHAFPLFGSTELLDLYRGKSAPIVFRLNATGLKLEGRLREDDSPAGSVFEGGDSRRGESVTADGVVDESLTALLLSRVDTERLMLGASEGEDGTHEEHLLEMLSEADGEASLLAAAALIRGSTRQDGERARELSALLIKAYRLRSHRLSADPDLVYGELAYCLTTLARYDADDPLYRLFLTDFGGREELWRYARSGVTADGRDLARLLSERSPRSVRELISHLLLLDKRSWERISGYIRGNHGLTDRIRRFAQELDDTVTDEDAVAVVEALLERYGRDKARFAEQLAAPVGEGGVAERTRTVIGHMRARFLHLMSEDDAAYFERLSDILTEALPHGEARSFRARERCLSEAYRELGKLEQSIYAHPCREAAELLLLSEGDRPNLLRRIMDELERELNALYADPRSYPRITCKLNHSFVSVEEGTLRLIVRNGDESEEGLLRAAEGLTLTLEPISEGIAVPEQVKLPRTRLEPGEELAVELELNPVDPTPRSVHIAWHMEYTCPVAFRSGETVARCFAPSEMPPFAIQIGEEDRGKRAVSPSNPYHSSGGGDALPDERMFFGRKEEKELIRSAFYAESENGLRLIPGRTVIVHGQKKSGKTSLVNQILSEISRDPSLSEQVLVLTFGSFFEENGGATGLPKFRQTLSKNVLSRFRTEVHGHPALERELLEGGFELPSRRELAALDNDSIDAYFDSFFRDFRAFDRGRHTVLLIMDEFTLLCSTLLEKMAQPGSDQTLATIPNFVKTFSGYGFSQLIIGHENMMRALGTLGDVNHTLEVAENVRVAALKEEDARDLIRQPMISAFGYDPYGTDLGESAVERLLELSGCNPSYLVRICERVFDYYNDPERCPRRYLLVSDIEQVVREMIDEYSLERFDILITEDGDEVKPLVQRDTYHFIKTVAQLSAASFDRRTAELSEVRRRLLAGGFSRAALDNAEDVLDARGVITVRAGRVQVNVGLFVAFIIQKFGGC